MSKLTLEQIESVHAARAAKKNGHPIPEHRENLDASDTDHDGDDAPNGYDDGDDGDDIDSLRAEIAKLRNENDAMRGRVAPSQQQAEEYRRLYDDERRLRSSELADRDKQIQELREKLNEDVNFEELLSEDERDMIDPMQLAIFKKIAKAMTPKVDVRTETAKLLEEREGARIARYREERLTDPSYGVSSLAHLAQDPSFIDWSNKEENDDFDPLVRSLLTARTEREIDKYAKAVSKRIAKFNESRGSSKSANRQTDAKTSLSRGMQRKPPSLSEREVDTKLAEATRLARSRNPGDRKKAEAILNSL